MLVRIDKIVLSAEQLAVPIPSLSTRQFVVSKVKRSLAQDRLDRELFWYREELLKLIQGSWNEVGFYYLSNDAVAGAERLVYPRLGVNALGPFLCEGYGCHILCFKDYEGRKSL